MDPAASGKQAIQFTGDGGTYFGIWIANLLLTIVTLGIYSPWAKVRRLRYFYGNTLVDGSPFEFHGSPIAILKGRLIAGALLIAYTQSAKFSTTLWIVVVAAIGVALPWLLWRSLRFRLTYSSYRGIRFGFDGALAGAYSTFLPLMLLFIAPAAAGIVATIAMGHPIQPGMASPAWFGPAMFAGLIVAMAISPWLYQRLKRYQHGHARLGSTRFSFSGTVGDSYLTALKILGIGFLGFIAAALVLVFVVAVMHIGNPFRPGAGTQLPAQLVTFFMVFALVTYGIILSLAPFYTSLLQNFVWNHTQLDDRSLESRLRGFALWRVDVVNAILVVLSLGLFWPFAVIRHLRVRIQSLAWTGDPAAVIAHAAEAPVGATGEEAADLFGFDLAL